MEDCIFCKIINKEIKSNILYEDDDFIIFPDLNPVSKYHYLAVPKQHFAHIADANAEQTIIIGRILRKIPELVDLLHLENGYRLVINQGEDACQTVQHLHIHILAGQKMGWQPA